MEQRFEAKMADIGKKMAEVEETKEDAERRIKDLANILARDEEQTCVDYMDVDFDATPDPTI
eukprot:12416848-Karenia_brevis.AAC.1